MSLKKYFLLKFLLLAVTIFLLPTLCQAKEDEIFTVSGAIESLSKDFKSIEVNEGRVLITSDTEIVDQWGKPLGLKSLRPKLMVTLQVLRRGDRFLARKIVVKTSNDKL